MKLKNNLTHDFFSWGKLRVYPMLNFSWHFVGKLIRLAEKWSLKFFQSDDVSMGLTEVKWLRVWYLVFRFIKCPLPTKLKQLEFWFLICSDFRLCRTDSARSTDCGRSPSSVKGCQKRPSGKNLQYSNAWNFWLG